MLNWTLLLGGWLATLVWLYHAWRLMTHIWTHTALNLVPDVPMSGNAPSVCVIVPACNEGEAVERCLRSLVAQDYPNLSIVAVNDRSTDDTGVIMDRVAADSERLCVIHNKELPDGWLGKNHANHVAACTDVAKASDYVLFTDGDIFFEPDCVRRAVQQLRDSGRDHLTLMPRLVVTGFAEKVMCHFFGVCFLLKCRIWAVENPRALRSFSGVGAFNLLRREAYDAIGGHVALRLEAVDDYKLGKLLKHAGWKSRALDSGGQIRVRWQIGLGGVIRGFEKNAFAGCDYSLVLLTYSVVILAMGFIAPLVLALAVPGPARWGWVAAFVIQVATMARVGKSFAMGLLSPVCGLLLIWALVRATVLTYRRGGVMWRGTLYPLAKLRDAVV